MLLKAAPAFSLLNAQVENQGSLFSSVSSSQSSLFSSFSSPTLRVSTPRNRTGAVIVCAAKGANNKPLTGVVFEPFEEVKKELDLVPKVPQVSLARQKYTDECEAAVNEQINVEYNVSYVYHAIFAYFDRDNIALKGLAKFFKESSLEEREHAEKLMKYQNKRGGKVKLQSIVMPLSEFDHAEKGDALYAMELTLSLEKLTNAKLLNLHSVAERNHDVQLTDFIEAEYLSEQVEAIKKIAEYVAQLRRVGKGHGVWHFDQMLLHEGEEAIA
ncbi:Ferritin/DPS protein domain - like 1 [Theobroma cacao]|uniref:Ferritin n=1 Tax=Theobroma cacao TaxID=3641 RepID=A0AB32UL16_THECC|nr:PREDICTED: ferritin-2, chloroplastic [Theobroma cacao]WRX12341.1 Ferritin/DPS protein domain - like 1 [Theobroma cacao]